MEAFAESGSGSGSEPMGMVMAMAMAMLERWPPRSVGRVSGHGNGNRSLHFV